MTPFGLVLVPGQSIFDQLVSAAQKAIVSGELTEGQDFPSVRTLAAELKIHPNTAHKAVQYLIQERWLEMRPGIGTVIAPGTRKLSAMRRELLEHEIAGLVAAARRIGLGANDLKGAIDAEFAKAAGRVEVGRR